MKRLKVVTKNMFFKTLQLIYCNCKFFFQDNAITHIAANTFLAKPNLTNVQLERNGLLALEMTSLMISISAHRSKKLIVFANLQNILDSVYDFSPLFGTLSSSKTNE